MSNHGDIAQIRKAVGHLDELLKLSSEGPWKADVNVRGDAVLWGSRERFVTNIESDHHRGADDDKASVMFDVDRNDALLMELLHATAPAVRAYMILGMHKARFGSDPYDNELAIANTILNLKRK